MASDKKFYKTVFSVEVLSEYRSVEASSLTTIAREIDQGDWSGHVEVVEVKELTGKEAADALQEQGSDPGFFMLNEDGSEVSD